MGGVKVELQNNKGFSLVEVLVSIVILAILFVTAMNTFATVTKVNAKTSKDQKASTLAQNILESLDTMSLEDTINQFHGTDFKIISSNLNDGANGYYNLQNNSYGEYMISDSKYKPATPAYLTTPNRTSYYLAIENVKDRGTSFDVMIKLDTSTYSDSKYDKTMNNYEMPNLMKLDASKVTIVDLKNDYDSIAYTNFISQYLGFLGGLATPVDPASSLSDDIKYATKKLITLDILKDNLTSSLNVKCNVGYSAKIGSGSLEKTYTDSTSVFNGSTLIPEGATIDGNVYFFYTPSMFTGNDVIKINNNGTKINFYLVNQKSNLATNINVTTNDTNSGVSTIFTNYQGTLINSVAASNKNLYTLQNKNHRIYDISVSVYPEGTLATQVLDKAYVTFQSAKEN